MRGLIFTRVRIPCTFLKKKYTQFHLIFTYMQETAMCIFDILLLVGLIWSL